MREREILSDYQSYERNCKTEVYSVKTNDRKLERA